MAEKLTPYDSAAYLKTDVEIAMYLEACAAEAGDDLAFMAQAISIGACAKNIEKGLFAAVGEGTKTYR